MRVKTISKGMDLNLSLNLNQDKNNSKKARRGTKTGNNAKDNTISRDKAVPSGSTLTDDNATRQSAVTDLAGTDIPGKDNAQSFMNPPDIFRFYRLDILHKIQTFALKSSFKKTWQTIDQLQEFRLLSELIGSDLEEYERQLYFFNGIPIWVTNGYERLCQVTDQDCTMDDQIHILIRMSTIESLKNPLCLHEARHIMEMIVNRVKIAELKLCHESDVKALAPLTLDEYREKYEERRFLGHWQVI
jgi:hypothetical protein